MKTRSESMFHIFTLFALLASLLGSMLIVTPVYAAGITVNTAVDELNTDGDCSLREAIQAANTDAIVDACTGGLGADIITLPAGTYTLAIAGVGEDLNATGDLDISSDITINGAGASTTIIQAHVTLGSGIDRVFHITGAYTVNISGVKIANGQCISCEGGGIYNGGTLTVTNSTFLGNSGTYGGGISNPGTLTMTDSIFSANVVSSDGGGVYNSGTLTVTNNTFSGNSANKGGGIFTAVGSTLTVTRSSFSVNVASLGGGGILSNGSATQTVTNSVFSGNSATTGGGISNLGTLLIVTNSTFSGNSANGGTGGGIINTGTLTVMNSTLSGNSATTGGGIYNSSTLNLYNTILANSASGGDCYNLGGNIIATDTNNLIETNGPSGHMCGTPTVTTDPSLGTLADNGGDIQTFALLYGSPAINAGDNTTCASASPGPNNLDQRGITRPQDGTCDIGAFESNRQPGPLFDVNTTEDSTDGACDAFVAGITNCTLREAITAANTLAGAETINVPAGVFTLAITGVNENANAMGDLDITGSLTIDGAGSGVSIIEAGAAGFGIDRVFHVIGAITVNISDLTIANGKCASCNGGGLSNEGLLTITNSTFSANTATANGGGLMNIQGGTIFIANSTFSGNSANVNGGGVANFGTASITNSTFSNNSSNNGGGLINNSGTATIRNSTFSGNSATTQGGGVFTLKGGAIAPTTSIRNTILANSTAVNDCSIHTLDTLTGGNNIIEIPSTTCSSITTLTSDPRLKSLTGSPAYFRLNTGSPAINAGNDAVCAAVPVNNTSQNGVTRPQGAHCDIGSFELPFTNLILRSVGANDGWVLESTETSRKGGTRNAAATTLRVGDDAADKQYRAILSFNTGVALPDNATITRVTLKVKRNGVTGGGNPVTLFQGFMVDIKKGTFGTSALANSDFQAIAHKTYGPFTPTLTSGWYTISLTNAKSYVNKLATGSGRTQIRLRFKLDDNNNNIANYLRLYSGNAGVASRPQLIIQYYVP